MTSLKSIRAGLYMGIAALAMMANPAYALPITFDFTGTAFIGNGLWAGDFATSKNVTGSYTYDTDITDTLGSGNVINKYLSNNAATASMPFTYEVTLGGTTKMETGSLDGSNLANFTAWDKAIDIYSFGNGNWGLTLHGNDADAVVYIDDSAPLVAPDLTKFGYKRGSWKIPGSNSDLLLFNLTSITLASNKVPEPATLTLLGFGLFGLGFCRRKRRT